MATSQPQADTLRSRVLRWTTNDVKNSTLFNSRMKDIPMEFRSTSEYLRAFRVPLLEEVRAQVHQALEKSIQDDDCVPVRDAKWIAHKTAKNQDPSMRKFSMSLSRQSTVTYLDLILLCSGDRPRWDSKRECLAPLTPQKFVLVCVVYAEEEQPFFTATAHLPDGSPIFEELRRPFAQRPTWFAVLLGMSLIPADRIWGSINETDSVQSRKSKTSVMQEVLRIDPQLCENLQRKPSGIKSLALPQEPAAVEILQLVGDYCKSRRLNDSQGDSLKSALAGLLSTNANCHVRLVQGPPGTGKTATLVPLISVLGSLRYRTLVSAPTNAAVLEVCKRFIGSLTQDSESTQKNLMVPQQQEMFSAFCSRIRGPAGSQQAGNGNKLSRCSQPIQLWEVVLVGSMERMEALVKGTVLEKVFLPYRIKRLTAALNPTTGWKGCVPAVEKFLTSAPAQFGHGSGKLKKTKSVNGAFWSFAKEYMKKMLSEMEKHLLTLTSELPRCHIDVKTSKAMTSTLELIRRIVNAMPREAPIEATTWFDGTMKSDALSEIMANLSLSGSQRSSSNNIPQLTFLQAKEALLTALASRAGCYLLVTKQNPQALQPKYEWLQSQCFTHATLVFSTVSTAGSPLMFEATFQCAIIDEASQLVEAESTIVSGKKGLKQLILVGDHKQLPAVVMSKAAEKSGYDRSLFDRLQTLKHGCRHMLNIQYRMKPEISRFPNSQFYDGGVQDGANVLSQEYGIRLAGASRYGAYAFVNCGFGAEEALQKGYKNSQEVAVVIRMVQHLGRVCEERRIEHLSIGIISPYAMQVVAVKQSLGHLHLHRALEVEVKSVDGFQGNERDVIIFTAVRANSGNQIGFVKDGRRLNVAITRGRHCVWIVGNAKTLSGGRRKTWKKLIADAKARNCFFDQSN